MTIGPLGMNQPQRPNNLEIVVGRVSRRVYSKFYGGNDHSQLVRQTIEAIAEKAGVSQLDAALAMEKAVIRFGPSVPPTHMEVIKLWALESIGNGKPHRPMTEDRME